MMDLINEYKKELISAIPVVSGMDLNIQSVNENEVHLKAPLNTHINYEGTAFGGSLNTVAILSAYLLCHHIMRIHKLDFKSLVIQDSSIKYLKPIHSDFIAKSFMELAHKNLFIKSLDKKGIGRATVSAQIYNINSQEVSVEFKGRFVASY